LRVVLLTGRWVYLEGIIILALNGSVVKCKNQTLALHFKGKGEIETEKLIIKFSPVYKQKGDSIFKTYTENTERFLKPLKPA